MSQADRDRLVTLKKSRLITQGEAAEEMGGTRLVQRLLEALKRGGDRALVRGRREAIEPEDRNQRLGQA